MKPGAWSVEPGAAAYRIAEQYALCSKLQAPSSKLEEEA